MIEARSRDVFFQGIGMSSLKHTDFSFVIAPPVLLLVCSVASTVSGGIPSWLVPWPFLFGLIVAGLPHGAIDLKLSQTLHHRAGLQSLIGFLWYVSIMLGVAGGLILAPVAVLTGFGILSAWHFGRADDRELSRLTRLPSPEGRGRLWSLSRGLTIIGLPFWLAPVPTWDVVNELLRFCGRAPVVAATEWATIAGWCLLVCLMVQISRIGRRVRVAEQRAARQESLELVSLVAAFAVLHPLFAMGSYFLIWHSWRHLRILNQTLHGASEQTTPLTGLLKLHRDALILLMPSLVAIVVLARWLGGSVTPMYLTLASLLVYVVVTLPHEMQCQQLFRSATGGRLQRQADSRASSANVSGTTRRIATSRPPRLGMRSTNATTTDAVIAGQRPKTHSGSGWQAGQA